MLLTKKTVFIKTKDGIKIKRFHKSRKIWVWDPYTKLNCINCKKECYIQQYTIKRSNHAQHCCSLTCKASVFAKNLNKKEHEILKMDKHLEFYYLLGLLATDGSVFHPKINSNSGSYYCTIVQHKKDASILYQIQSLFGGKIYEYNQIQKSGKISPIVTWRLSCKPFINFLIKIGITPRKSLTMKINKQWFKKLPKKYQFSFIRGVIDGDGHVNGYKTNKYIFIASSSSSFRQFLFSFFKKYGPSEYDNRTSQGVYLGINQNSKTLFDKIFFEEFGIDRKRLKYRSLS